MCAVWITEEDETSLDGTILLGTFCAYHDSGGPSKGPELFGLDIDAAIAWGRARANRVYVTVHEGRYDASETPAGEYPRWPPPGLERPRRRRPPGEEWKDRTDADEPIEWDVAAWLSRADGVVPGRDRDPEIAAIAEASGAEGWDADSLDAAWRQIERADGGKWFSWDRPAFRIRFLERAPSGERAVRQAARRCGTHHGWSIEFEATPAR